MPTPPLRALVVTSSRARGALAAARALGSTGWDVGVGTPDDGGMVAASRFTQRHHRVPRPRGDGEAFVAGVRQAIDDAGYSVVFGGGDDWIAALSHYRDRIPAQVAHPDVDVVSRALDKDELVARANKHGLASPRTELATDAVRATWRGPVVVKCRSHWFPGQEQRLRIEARWFPDIAAAAERIRFLEESGFDVVLQQPIAGPLGALIGVVEDGRLVGRVQQTAHGVWPTPSGVSSRAVTEPVDEDFAARIEAMLADLGWSGLVEVQYLTPPGGDRHVIDLNGRFYGSMALAIAAGVNLPDAWGRQVLGLPMPDLADADPGVQYVWAAGDLRRAVVERRGGIVADLSSSLGRIVSRAGTTSVLDVRDPGPAFHLLTARLRRAAAGAK